MDSAEIERHLEQLRTALRRSGVKLTHQRLEIFREIASRVDHPGVDAVFQAVNPPMRSSR